MLGIYIICSYNQQHSSVETKNNLTQKHKFNEASTNYKHSLNIQLLKINGQKNENLQENKSKLIESFCFILNNTLNKKKQKKLEEKFQKQYEKEDQSNEKLSFKEQFNNHVNRKFMRFSVIIRRIFTIDRIYDSLNLHHNHSKIVFRLALIKNDYINKLNILNLFMKNNTQQIEKLLELAILNQKSIDIKNKDLLKLKQSLKDIQIDSKETNDVIESKMYKFHNKLQNMINEIKYINQVLVYISQKIQPVEKLHPEKTQKILKYFSEIVELSEQPIKIPQLIIFIYNNLLSLQKNLIAKSRKEIKKKIQKFSQSIYEYYLEYEDDTDENINNEEISEDNNSETMEYNYNFNNENENIKHNNPIGIFDDQYLDNFEQQISTHICAVVMDAQNTNESEENQTENIKTPSITKQRKGILKTKGIEQKNKQTIKKQVTINIQDEPKQTNKIQDEPKQNLFIPQTQKIKINIPISVNKKNKTKSKNQINTNNIEINLPKNIKKLINIIKSPDMINLKVNTILDFKENKKHIRSIRYLTNIETHSVFLDLKKLHRAQLSELISRLMQMKQKIFNREEITYKSIYEIIKIIDKKIAIDHEYFNNKLMAEKEFRILDCAVTNALQLAKEAELEKIQKKQIIEQLESIYDVKAYTNEDNQNNSSDEDGDNEPKGPNTHVNQCFKRKKNQDEYYVRETNASRNDSDDERYQNHVLNTIQTDFDNIQKSKHKRQNPNITIAEPTGLNNITIKETLSRMDSINNIIIPGYCKIFQTIHQKALKQEQNIIKNQTQENNNFEEKKI